MKAQNVAHALGVRLREIVHIGFSSDRNSKRDGCEGISALLSRFLDKDLTSAAATRVASHLHGCLACRGEFEALRAQQSMLSALAVPGGSTIARERVMLRLEAGVRVSPSSAPSAPRRVRYPFAGAACAVVLIVAFVLLARQLSPNAGIVISPVSDQAASMAKAIPTPRALPANKEVAALFEAHDRKRSAFESAASVASSSPQVQETSRKADKPVVAPSVAGSVLSGKKPSEFAVQADTSTSGASSADTVTADEVPEAL